MCKVTEQISHCVINSTLIISFLQLQIESINAWRIYETLTLGSPVLRDMNLDAEKQHVTVLTELEVSHINKYLNACMLQVL